MDEELKQYLEDMRSGIIGRIDRSAEATATELSIRFGEVNTKLTSIDTRLKLQAGLIQSGSRAMARFSEFAESSEERWVALVTRVEALERKLENGTGKKG